MDNKTEKLIEKNLKVYSFANNVTIDKEIALIEKDGVSIITIDDERYPDNLRHIYSPPSLLYVRGNFAPEDYYNIAIVGSRRASLYGRQNAEKIARQLAERGFTVTSGMARGIDTFAHRGALKACGRTIAVLGCGINIIYPPENKNLMEEISHNGAVVSEFPMNTPPHRQNFPIRNRIISGLSLGVVVVEAAEKSGALITASFALEQGREVFSVPGRIDMPTSKGTSSLIKDGAKLVEGVEDILEELRSMPNVQAAGSPSTLLGASGQPSSAKASEGRQAAVRPKLTEEEAEILNSLSDGPKHIDEISSNINSSNVCNILLKLELKKLIRELPGKMFVKI